MFNPTNLDEVCVQATHIESKGKSSHDNFSSAKSIQSKEGKEKGKRKHTTTMNKGDTKLLCSHFQKVGHDEEHIWKLHPDLKPKWDQHQRGKKKTTTAIQYDLGSESEDESKVSVVGIKGILSNVNTCASSSEKYHDEKERDALFHLRVISKHTKIDTLIDSGSQANLISENLVN